MQMSLPQVPIPPMADKRQKLMHILVQHTKGGTDKDYLSGLEYTQVNRKTASMVKNTAKKMSKKLDKAVDREIKLALLQYENNEKRKMTYRE